jgi:hypothetical protein
MQRKTLICENADVLKYTKKFVIWLTVKRYHKHKMKCALIIQMFYCKQ